MAMHLQPVMLLSLVFALAVAARSATAPTFQQYDLFRQGDLGVHTYRIPALLQTQKGTLIAVVDARHDSDHDLPARITLSMRRSFDLGQTWTSPKTIQAPEVGGVGDASLLLDRKTGRVWLFYAYGAPGIGTFQSHPGTLTGPTTLQFHSMHSDDDGESWSKEVDLTPQVKDPSWRSLFATSGTDIQTRSGRFLVPLVVLDAEGVFSSRNAYSDDAGKTWKVGPAAGFHTDESHNVELKDGTILQNMRNGKTRAIARSHDGGVTFDPMDHDPALIDPACNASITRYVYGTHDVLLFTNAASSRRENLTVKLSYDDGHTWPVSRVVYPGPAAYSTVIPLHDGTIGLLYERGDAGSNEKITFARFTPDWVTQAPE